MKSKIRKYISVFVLSALLLMVGCGNPPMPPSDAEMMSFKWDIIQYQEDMRTNMDYQNLGHDVIVHRGIPMILTIQISSYYSLTHI